MCLSEEKIKEQPDDIFDIHNLKVENMVFVYFFAHYYLATTVLGNYWHKYKNRYCSVFPQAM